MSLTTMIRGFSPKKAKQESEIKGGENLNVKKLTQFATLPTRGSNQAAGYDLYSAYDVCIGAGEKALVKTDIAVALPEGCYGRVGEESCEVASR